MNMTWTREPDAEKALVVFDLGDDHRTTFELWLHSIDLAFEIENMLRSAHQVGLIRGYKDATQAVENALAEGRPK